MPKNKKEMIDLVYILQVNIFLTIAGAAVLIASKHQPYHQFNRGLILSTVSFALLIPLLSGGLDSSIILSYELNPIIIGSDSASNVSKTSFLSGLSILEMLYLLGFLVSLFYFLLNLIKLMKLLGPKSFLTNRTESTSKGQGSSSFFRTIFIEPQQDRSDEALIMEHERVHVQEYHSIDKLFMNIVQVFCWFNPIIYLLNRKLEAVHEFRADEVMANKTNTEIYSYLLISQATGVERNILMNKFSKSSLLKQRIMMLNKANKTKRKSNYGFIIPALIAAILIASCVKEPGDNASAEQRIASLSTNEDVYKEVDEMPVFAEGKESLVDFFIREVKYPESCKADEVTGKVLINFIVDEEGNASNFEVIKSPDERLTMAALDVMAEMPKWTPGKLDGKNVKTQLTLPIMYALN